jgi:hypothetical protein
MEKENDSSEALGMKPAEQTMSRPEEAARLRIREDQAQSVQCEHSASDREAYAIERSARLIDEWEVSKPLVREKILERVGREMMDVHEAPPPPIHSKEMKPGALGANRDGEFIIDMNSDLFEQPNPKDALETYLHEYRHAEQRYEVLKSHGALRHSVDIDRAMALEESFDKYIKPEVDGAAYRRQIVEADAEQFGVSATEGILEQRDFIRHVASQRASSESDFIAAERLDAERSTRK